MRCIFSIIVSSATIIIIIGIVITIIIIIIIMPPSLCAQAIVRIEEPLWVQFKTEHGTRSHCEFRTEHLY